MTEENKEDNMMVQMKELLDMSELENLISSNEQIFDVDDVTYRVTKPTYKQRQESYKKKIEKYAEFLKDKSYMLQEDLKKIYLDRGLDTDEILKLIKGKSTRRDSLMVQLGESLAHNAPDTELESIRDEIKFLNEEIQQLSIKHTMLFEVSLEQQVMISTISYLTFLLLEKKDGENWVRAWDKYEDFENAKEKLINRSTYYVTLMSGNNEF